MPSESRKPVGLCLCFLILGVLIGISIDAEFRPNHILFWVNPVQDLSLRFVPGDTIEWYQVGTGEPVGISFWGGSPCVGGSNPCTIKNIPDTATYYYTCTASDGTTCNDPQGGPISSTQRLEATGFFTKISDLIRNIFAPLTHILGHSPRPGSPEATQKMASTAATGQAKIAVANAIPSATYSTIHAEASCDASGGTHVTVAGQHEDDPIQASVGQKILWGTTATGDLTIHPADASTCSPFSSPAKNQYLCTVAAKSGKWNYTATALPCTANTSEYIAVP